MDIHHHPAKIAILIHFWYVALFSAINHSMDWLCFLGKIRCKNPMGNPSEKPVSPESSIDFRRGFPMDFLWFSYGFPIKTSIFLWISQRIFPALHEKRGVRSPRRGTAAGVLWDAAGGAFFFALRSRWKNIECTEYPLVMSTVCYWKWPFIVELPIKMVIFHSYVSLPEGNDGIIIVIWCFIVVLW